MAEQIAFGRRKNAVDQQIGFLPPFIFTRRDGKAERVWGGPGVGLGCSITLGRRRPKKKGGGVKREKIITAGIGIDIVRIQRSLPAKRSLKVGSLAGRLKERQGRA